MMKILKSKLVLLFLLLPLSGCVGFSIEGGSTGVKYSNSFPRLEQEKGYVDSRDRGRLVTKELMLTSWGRPDEIVKLEGGATKWIYHRERAWYGLQLFVIVVPVPLMLPYGYRDTEVILKHDRVVSILYHIDPDPGWGCYAYLIFFTPHGSLEPSAGCSFELNPPWREY